MAQIRSCSDTPDKGDGSVFIPQDSSFVPVVKQEYRPRSTPFERSVKAPAPMPKDAPEANVARTVAIVKRIPVDSVGNAVVDTTFIVITKDGNIFVPKQQGIKTDVGVWEFLPPILEWNLFLSAGVNISKSLSPSAAVAPLKIMGKVTLPSLIIDPDGIGIGAGWHEKDFIIGVLAHRRFEETASGFKLFVHYSL